ncbi:ABC transporter permease, partial [Staphylococcus sp. SIMBA_130]
LVLWPCIIFSLIMIAFNLLGDGLRDAFDPKLRK